MEHCVWSIHGQAGQTSTPAKRKTRDMTRHGIRDIDISSRRVGPAFPVLTGTGKNHQSLTSPLSTSSQSMNQMSCESPPPSPHRQQQPGQPWTRSTSVCKTTIHVTCDETSSPATQSSNRSRCFRPHSHTSPHRVLGKYVSGCRAAV